MIILKMLKNIVPKIFEQASPKFHIKVLDFLLSNAPKKALVLFRGASKTTLITKGMIFAKIFFKKEPYVLMVSSTSKKSEAFLEDLKKMVLSANKMGFAIRKGKVWSKEAIEIVVGRGDDVVVCRVEAISAMMDPRGSGYDFSRPTLIVCDDLETTQGKFTIKKRANREALRKWFTKELVPALDTAGEIWLIGTILHADSLLNNILKNKTWKVLNIPLVVDGKSSWKSRHPLTIAEAELLPRIRGKRVKSVEDIRLSYLEDNDLNAYYQEYLNIPQAIENQLFKREYFRYIERVVFEKKIYRKVYKNAKDYSVISYSKALYVLREDGTRISLYELMIFTTMDIASDGKDRTAITTRGYDSEGNKYHLDTRAGSWTPYQKSLEAIKVQLMFEPIRFGIERGGMQNDFFYTIDEAQKATGVIINVDDLKHGGVNKNIRMSNMEPAYRMGKVFHNRSCPHLDELEAQLEGFDIDTESLIDDIMDADAYQNQFSAFINFEVDEDDEEEINTFAAR